MFYLKILVGALVGRVGSGKSTLLHLLATLDQPDAGEIYFEGNRIDCLPAASRDILPACGCGKKRRR